MNNLNRIMGPVARELLGDPTEEHRDELRFGSRGSLCVDLSKGTFFDHEAGEGGGVIALVMRERRVDKAGAMTWLRDRGHLPKVEAKPRATIVKTYDYTDADGTLLFQVCRMEPKDFRQRRPDGPGKWVWKMTGVQRVIYRLPDVLIAVAEGRPVYVTEGEKAADRLAELGLTATCSPGGANKWHREYAPFLAGADVVILPDNDDPGRSHAAMVAASVGAGAARLRVLALPGLPEKGDVFDWIGAGGTAEALGALAADAPAPVVVVPDKPVSDGDTGLLTEHNVALVFAAEHKDELRYCHHAQHWFVWTGTHWRREESKLAFTWARQLVAKLNVSEEAKVQIATGKAAFSAAVERYALADRTFALTSDKWDRDGWLLGTPAGTIDLHTGELRPAKREDHITKQTGVAPAPPGTAHPAWSAFLDQATGGDAELQAFLQRLFGYMLTGDVSEEVVAFLYGEGGTGKGTLISAVVGIMGDYAVSVPIEVFTANSRLNLEYYRAQMAGARLVTASETEQGATWAEAQIKEMSGNEAPLSGRHPYGKPFTFHARFKIGLVGNHAPRLKGRSRAMERRLRIAPFKHIPPKADLKLKERLRAEWPAILRWLIDGCLAWQRDGLGTCPAVAAETDAYFAQQDHFGRWMAERCLVGSIIHPVSERPGKLLSDFVQWAKENGEQPMSAGEFRELVERTGGLRYALNKGVQWVRGLALKPTSEPSRRHADAA